MTLRWLLEPAVTGEWRCPTCGRVGHAPPQATEIVCYGGRPPGMMPRGEPWMWRDMPHAKAVCVRVNGG